MKSHVYHEMFFLETPIKYDFTIHNSVQEHSRTLSYVKVVLRFAPLYHISSPR